MLSGVKVVIAIAYRRRLNRGEDKGYGYMGSDRKLDQIAVGFFEIGNQSWFLADPLLRGPRPVLYTAIKVLEIDGEPI